MGGVICTLTGPRRHKMSVTATNLSLLLAYLSDILVTAALYIKFVVESGMAVVIGSHAGALAYFLLTVGLVLCFVCVASAKMTYDIGFQETATKRTCKILLFTIICQAATLLLLLVAIVMCFVHKRILHDVLHNGFMAAIRLYRVNDRVKTGINQIQAGYQCCGSRSIHDWFKTPWIPMTYLDVDHPEVAKRIEDGAFLTDDAPYSCCNVQAGRPCVHHQVQNMSAHQMVGPGGTLYTTPCSQRLETYWRSSILNPVLCLLFFMLVLLVVSMMLSRLLQTSLDNALLAGNPMADGEAYFIKPFACLFTLRRKSSTRGRRRLSGRAWRDGGDRRGLNPDESQDMSSNRSPDRESHTPGYGGDSTDHEQLGKGHHRYGKYGLALKMTKPNIRFLRDKVPCFRLNRTSSSSNSYSTAGRIRDKNTTQRRRHGLKKVRDFREDARRLQEKDAREKRSWKGQVQRQNKGKEISQMERERKMKRKKRKARREMENLRSLSFSPLGRRY